jgi:type IV pilus assembly protein PilB
MTPPTQTGAPPNASAKPKKGSGVTTPSRRGGSGRVLADVIVDLGFVAREAMDEAIDRANGQGSAPERLLVADGVLTDGQLARAVAERFGLDHLDLGSYRVDPDAAKLVTPAAVKRYQALPVSFSGERTLLVAMVDPANVLAVDDIQMMTGLTCQVAVAPEEDIEALIGRMTTLESAVSEAVSEEEELEGEAQVTELRESADDAPVIKLVYSVLAQAVSEGASDIHFEPDEGEMRVRFRVDGVLHETARVPKRMISGVISRVKLMADMDIAQKRVPQDGRVGVNVEDRKVDLRVTTLPTQRGEGCAIRILDKDKAMRTLDELGMGGEGRGRFEAAFTKPHGAVLVTGPTGSGKSTTLYAALQELNAVERHIITIEDPVEYRISGISQLNVNRKAGLTFAGGLRSILRADPDVIMVGEIRDEETARIAIEAALTGHMVLTTLHTNDAPGAVARLTKMGIEGFLTASAVDCVVAQRLARELCTQCKRRTVIPQEGLTAAGFRVGADLEAYEPAGCARCSHTGYRGRIGLYSVMPMSEEIKELTVAAVSEAEIAAAAREQGMLTLREDGLQKVRDGVTSIEEVARVST